ncbi:MAG: hypothetical protein R3F59_33230 [Myxococcota bacterium]
MDLPSVVVHRLDEVVVDEHHLVGPANATGALTLADTVSFDGTIELHGARILVDDVAASTLSGVVVARSEGLVRFAPIDASVLDGLSATVTVQAEARDLGFVGSYLASVPWLTVSGPAHLDVEMALAHGRVQPGGRILARTDGLTLGIRSYHVVGAGVLSVNVDDEATRLAVQLGDYALLAPGDSDPDERTLVSGQGFQVTASSPSADLREPLADLSVVVDLPDAELRNASLLADFVPPEAGLRLLGGTGRIRGHLALRADDAAHATGDVHLAGRDLTGRFGTLRFETDVDAHARLAQGDLVLGTYDVSGTDLRVSRMRLWDPDDGDDERPERTWWARIALPRAALALGDTATLDADLTFDCADSGPLVDLVAQRRSLAGWVQQLLSKPDVKGRARLVVADEVFAVKKLAVEAGKGAEVRLEMRRTKRGSRGAMFAKLGPMALAMEFADKEKHLHLTNPRSWYADRTAPKEF